MRQGTHLWESFAKERVGEALRDQVGGGGLKSWSERPEGGESENVGRFCLGQSANAFRRSTSQVLRLTTLEDRFTRMRSREHSIARSKKKKRDSSMHFGEERRRNPPGSFSKRERV